MAFINPSTISTVTREEFEELKKKVSEIDSELSNVKKSGISNNNLSESVEETIINSSAELNEEVYTLREDINISNASLTGIPKIDYFNFSKEEKNTEDNADSNIINLSDVLNLNVEEKEFTYRVDNIPVVAKTSSGHRTALMDDTKVSNLRESYYGDARKIAA